MHRLIRFLVKVFADVFTFISGTAFGTATFVCPVSIQPIQALMVDCYGCACSAVLMNCIAFDPANCYGKVNEFLKEIIMRRLVIILLVIVFMVPSFVAFAQDQPCSKPKISVNADAITEEIYDFFQSQYAVDTEHDNMLPGFDTWQTYEDWLVRIHDYLINFLQESNPSVNFISKGGDDCDYSFTYSISTAEVDYVDTTISVVRTDIGYGARAKLSTNNACGENRQVDTNFGNDLDLFQAIKNMIAQFGPIDRVLYYYEKNYLSPPRGPRILATTKDRNYVSPLENEQQIEINLEVRNCKNEIVYEKSHGHEVELQSKTNRSELKNNIKQQAAFTVKPGNPLIIGIIHPKTASVFYKLKKGMSPKVEEVTIETCGRDRMEIKTVKININGLEIKVKPKQSTIFSKEKTSIDIYFNRISPNGNKRPIANKQLNLSVKGIVDGSISPSKTVTTDSAGKATIKYTAGKKDELITIVASYHPKDYPDIVQGKAEIKVSKREWRGTLSLEVTRRFQCNEEEQTSELSRREVRSNDEKTQKVNLTISMDDFDLALNPSIPGTNLIREASGEMQCMISEDHFTAGRLEKTECHKEGGGGGRSWEWVSPGNWSTNHETLTGQASRTIKKENINLLIVKDIELNKEAMENLQQQIQEAAKNKDYATIQKLSGQMTGMVQGDQDNNVIPVRIRIEIVFDLTKKDLITTTYERKVYYVCLGRYKEDESGTNTIELPIALPMVAEMKGTYTRGKDGSDTIMATINMTETSYCMFYTDICPDATTTINGQINLERQ